MGNYASCQPPRNVNRFAASLALWVLFRSLTELKQKVSWSWCQDPQQTFAVQCHRWMVFQVRFGAVISNACSYLKQVLCYQVKTKKFHVLLHLPLHHQPECNSIISISLSKLHVDLSSRHTRTETIQQRFLLPLFSAMSQKSENRLHQGMSQSIFISLAVRIRESPN